MKTLEEREAEFKSYVVEKLKLTLHSEPTPQDLRTLAHNLIQDFKEEIEGFNTAMEEELAECKEQIEHFKEAFNTFKSEVEG